MPIGPRFLLPFSPDYFSARNRFRHAGEGFGNALESLPITPRGPQGQELSLDVVHLKQGRPEATLILSSGLHGSEGIFGSAVQIAALLKWAQAPPRESIGVLILHALNPYGFAWMRRTNELNIDLNRNFLLPGETYSGSPPLYHTLDPLLNPKRPPSRWEPFRLKAYGFIARYGLRALMQAIAGGQYDFPRGLFFGGQGTSETMQLLQQHLPRWLDGSRRVLHLDLHTGLGRRGDYKLLMERPPSAEHLAWLHRHFGADAVESNDTGQTAYTTRGSLGQWCAASFPDRDYTYLCAEFGTYPPLQVIGGLRAENQAHFWDKPESANTRRVKERLKELLNPAAADWRDTVIRKSMRLVEQAVGALTK